ncbi:hypothetical protein A9Q83_04225 [Alphaproteobacteria bacterium 46_93_T64]|nr:hypothetical protein A9Q83_04225 [Alphaproteobacteria bacterium 46_93_T64]
MSNEPFKPNWALGIFWLAILWLMVALFWGGESTGLIIALVFGTIGLIILFKIFRNIGEAGSSGLIFLSIFCFTLAVFFSDIFPGLITSILMATSFISGGIAAFIIIKDNKEKQANYGLDNSYIPLADLTIDSWHKSDTKRRKEAIIEGCRLIENRNEISTIEWPIEKVIVEIWYAYEKQRGDIIKRTISPNEKFLNVLQELLTKIATADAGSR